MAKRLDTVRAARTLAMATDRAGRSLQFDEADVASDRSPRLDGGPFDIVVCESAGFGQIGVTIERETSSRRPNEAAHFLSVTCRPA